MPFAFVMVEVLGPSSVSYLGRVSLRLVSLPLYSTGGIPIYAWFDDRNPESLRQAVTWAVDQARLAGYEVVFPSDEVAHLYIDR